MCREHNSACDGEIISLKQLRKPRFYGAFFMPAVIPAFYVIPDRVRPT
jgi:hypothetical protein